MSMQLVKKRAFKGFSGFGFFILAIQSREEQTITAECPETDRAAGFAPIARTDAEILILGSLPGRRSIAAQQYYAHPQNAFWRIMQALLGAGGDYAARCETLIEHRIAVWDVLADSVREGSMDAGIHVPTAAANDFARFYERHPQVSVVAFNGKTAERLYRGLVSPLVGAVNHRYLSLPSTSPAYAAMPFDDKLIRWRALLTDGETRK